MSDIEKREKRAVEWGVSLKQIKTSSIDVFPVYLWHTNGTEIEWDGGKKKSRNEDIRSEEEHIWTSQQTQKRQKKSWLFSDRMWRKIEIDAHNGGDVVVREFRRKSNSMNKNLSLARESRSGAWWTLRNEQSLRNKLNARIRLADVTTERFSLVFLIEEREEKHSTFLISFLTLLYTLQVLR